MSKMSELATVLDELTETGRNLMACGEDMMKAAARLRDCFSSDSEQPAAQTVETPAPQSQEEPPRKYTKEEVRAILAGLSQNGFRSEAKALVRKYSDGGSLTDIDPAKYPDLVAEAEAYHA